GSVADRVTASHDGPSAPRGRAVDSSAVARESPRMTAAFAFASSSESRRADERRLSVAIGASLVIHALILALLRGVVPTTYATPQGGTGGFSALQAVLAGPKVEPAPEAPQVESPQPIVAPPEVYPIEPPVVRRSQAGPEAASATEKSGATLPD